MKELKKKNKDEMNNDNDECPKEVKKLKWANT